MAQTIKRPFRSFNGTDWDKHYFETSADQVKMNDGTNVELAVYDKDRQYINIDTDISNSNTIQVTVPPDSIIAGDKFYVNGQIYTVTSVQLA